MQLAGPNQTVILGCSAAALCSAGSARSRNVFRLWSRTGCGCFAHPNRATQRGLPTPAIGARVSAACAAAPGEIVPHPGGGPGPIQRIGFHSLLNVRSRTAEETRLAGHMTIN